MQDLSAITFDSLAEEASFPLGSYRMTREEVIEFASKWDPQPYHLDDAAAQASPVFGRLSASGWHTSMVLNLLLDRFWKATSVRGMAGGGIDGVRWLSPVYPGDTLTGEVEIISKRNSQSRPDRGIMTMRVILRNQDGVAVIDITLTGIFARA